jgi:3-phenylpropionate/trans-cinnamate dioxygenase ferredoxin subunit
MTVVGRFDELADGAVRGVDVDGVAVAVVRIGDEIYAVDDICSHAHILLSGGEVWCDELEIECPKHGSMFSLVTGAAITLPATQPIAVHHASVVDGDVVVTLGNGADNATGAGSAGASSGREATS